jgi:hypothetical protein
MVPSAGFAAHSGQVIQLVAGWVSAASPLIDNRGFLFDTNGGEVVLVAGRQATEVKLSSTVA